MDAFFSVREEIVEKLSGVAAPSGVEVSAGWSADVIFDVTVTGSADVKTALGGAPSDVWDVFFSNTFRNRSWKGNKKSVETRGRILGRNWDKSLESFHPCYSQSPLLTVPPPLSKSGLKLVCNVNIVNGKLRSKNWEQDYAQKPQRKYTFMHSASGPAGGGRGMPKRCRLYGIIKRPRTKAM